ncbi:MAG: hypothetical protein U9N35_09035 [Euryarchaeota archaeon]|nr:hypothetical protein [Euryarchaeota archaeon]
MGKKVTLTILTFLLLHQLVSADVIFPLTFTTLPLIPFIILIEVLTFWLLANKVIKASVSFWKSVLVIFVANIITSLLGIFIYLPGYTTGDSLWLGITYMLSVFVEWGIYTPFFIKDDIKILDLLKISFVENLISYAMIVFFQFV